MLWLLYLTLQQYAVDQQVKVTITGKTRDSALSVEITSALCNVRVTPRKVCCTYEKK